MHAIIKDIQLQSPFKYQETTEELSFISHEAEDPKFLQTDSYNCGIICLIQCVELYRGKFKFHKIAGLKQKQKYVEFRLNLLSLIRDMYEELNSDIWWPLVSTVHCTHAQLLIKVIDIVEF